MTKEDLYEKYKAIVASQSTIEHIFVGEINRRGIAVGFHFEGQFSLNISNTIPGTKTGLLLFLSRGVEKLLQPILFIWGYNDES